MLGLVPIQRITFELLLHPDKTLQLVALAITALICGFMALRSGSWKDFHRLVKVVLPRGKGVPQNKCFLLHKYVWTHKVCGEYESMSAWKLVIRTCRVMQ